MDGLDITVRESNSLTPPRGILSSRLFAPTSWRGGLGYVSSYDEIIEPNTIASTMNEIDANAAIIIGGDWTELDAKICDEIIERHLESPEAHRTVFSQASVGLAGVVVSQSILRQMAELRRDDRTGSLLGVSVGYVPTRATSDPITKSWCVGVDLDNRTGNRRYTAGPPATLPTHLTLELTTERTLHHPTGAACTRTHTMETDRARAIIDALDPTTQPIALSLAGFGDALLHAGTLDIIRYAKARGIGAVHVRTDLLLDSENELRALLESGADAISIDISATSPTTYEQLRGKPLYDKAVKNAEWLLHNRTFTNGVPDVWIVPRITRRDEVYEEIEPFYDGWLITGASPVIDSLHAPIDGARIEPLGKPKYAELRDRRTGMLIRADGSVPVNAHDETSEIAGNAFESPLTDAWASLLAKHDAITAQGWHGPDDLLTESP